MGKTIMLSALIQIASEPEAPPANADPEPQPKRRQLRLDNTFRVTKRKVSTSKKGPCATLIVAPTSLLNQWAEELKRSSKPDTMDVLVWHGQNRLDLEAMVERDGAIPVVITSYGTLVSEYSRWSDKIASPIFESAYHDFSIHFTYLSSLSRVAAYHS